MVALLAEGVDRNIFSICALSVRDAVALLAEGVDRNVLCVTSVALSQPVALLAEGVDRNSAELELSEEQTGRPPRRGRG